MKEYFCEYQDGFSSIIRGDRRMSIESDSPEEVLRDLREEREIKAFLTSYDPFIDHYCFDEPIQTAKDGDSKATLCQAAKARTANC